MTIPLARRLTNRRLILSWGRIWLCYGTAAVVIAGCGTRSIGAGSGSPPVDAAVSTTGSARVAPATTVPGGAFALQQAFVDVVAKVRPQVVEISTNVGLGSGVIFDSRGDIVTNDHVVGTAGSFEVNLVNGQALAASLVGTYPPDDLAVIRVSGSRNLSPATFGNSAELQVGDIVFAVGNPLGLASSVTEGIVSYNGRAVGEGNGVELPSTIQTSAAINPGNSGGALVDLAGEVVGIPTLAAVDQQVGGVAAGIGFAIPSNIVKSIVPQLIAYGHVVSSGRAALGITGSDAVDASGNPAGVIVANVTNGGAAANAGISPGDVITSVNGHRLTSLADLQDVLAGLAPGDSVTVGIISRAGTNQTLKVILGQLSG